MAVSKAIKSFVDADTKVSERDLIRMHYRSRGKVALTEKAKELLERAEEVKTMLKENRNDMQYVKTTIAERYGLKHRSEVDRCIEDAVYLFGCDIVMQKSYQRFLQLQDIEWGISLAKEVKDLIALEKFLARREKLFALDTPDELDEFVYFSAVVINARFMPESFPRELPSDWEQRAQNIKLNAMRELGLVQDVTDAEYTTE